MTVPIERRRETGYRRTPLWGAAMVHRLSGVALACFLPLHFLALGLAIEGEAALEGFLRWTDSPLLKLSETALVFALAVHLLGGLRILLIENLSWRPGQAFMALSSIVAAGLLAVLFAARVL